MKSLFTQLIISACLLLSGRCLAQDHWPKTIYVPDGGYVNIYRPQVESFIGNIMTFKSTISMTASGSDDPVFGVFWTTDTVKTDRRKREVTIRSVKVDDIRMSADDIPFAEEDVKPALEACIPKLIHPLSLDGVLASLDRSDQETALAGDISNGAPRLIFRTSPSMLVPIDGQPILRDNKDWGLDVVVNSPATIIKNKDGQFYLYAGGNWYVAPDATGPYTYTDNVQHSLRVIARGLEKAAKRSGGAAAGGAMAGGGAAGGTAAGAKGKSPVCDIVISTVPAELIQSDGSPDLQPVSATALRYVSNSGHPILMDTTTKLYYMLLSGRWYRSDSLNENGQWQYVAADQLPWDFARIPAGSPIADVLPSVAGTPEAKEAIMDAQVPQVEKIDRKATMTDVVYDGVPRFQAIEGTDMQYAVNTCATVVGWRAQFYAVDDGVWFTAGTPVGPWTVSAFRPDEMDLVPPDCPIYNARYVDIYQVSNDYVYDGYTPGYLNSYIGDCTVVYGTGFYYRPWMGSYYYPRPWTWGFGMCYDPWYGWAFGMDYDCDLFDCGWGWDAGFGFVWGGGYGRGGGRGIPGIYHPAYPLPKPGHHFRYERHGGFIAIDRSRRVPQGQGQPLVNGRPATLTAGTATRTVAGTAARSGYGGLRTGGYTAGVRGGGYAGMRSAGGSSYNGRGSTGGGYSGGRSGGGGGYSGGSASHVSSSGGGSAGTSSSSGGGGGHVAASSGGGSSSGGSSTSSGGHH
jgi:hypothetical protein